MYNDYYDYKMRQREQTKSERMVAGSIGILLGGIVGGILGIAFFLIRRFDILSSGISALLFYICTYQQKWDNKIYVIAASGIFMFSMLLQYVHKIFRLAYLLLICGFVAVFGATVVESVVQTSVYLIMGICFVATACLGILSWTMIYKKGKDNR